MVGTRQTLVGPPAVITFKFPLIRTSGDLLTCARVCPESRLLSVCPVPTMNTSSLHRPFLSPWRALGAPPPIYSRKYALSRFPDRKPGVGRVSRRPIPRLTQDSQANAPDPRATSEFTSGRGFEQESDPSTGESPLWKESQRRPMGHPEEGIKRLLLGNNTLTVTRCEGYELRV